MNSSNAAGRFSGTPQTIIHLIEASATGTLSMASLLANTQAQHGHRVHVIYSRRPETPDDIASHFDGRVTLLNLQMRSTFEKVLALLPVRRQLTRATAVFLHSSFAGFIGRIAGLGLARTKFFYIPHCISFMRRDIGRLQRILFVGLEWLAALKRATYIACSESENREISRLIPFRRCVTVENAISLDSTPKKNDASAQDQPCIVTVGQIRDQKGPSQFASVARSVREVNPDVRFLWIGDGSSRSRAELEAAGVTVSGWLGRQDVLKHLASASIYLSTANWEGMPVSIIEANYCGVPVVASRCSGNVDVVEHNRTGWLFDTSEEAALRILLLLREPAIARSTAEWAAELAMHRFSTTRYQQEMLDLLAA